MGADDAAGRVVVELALAALDAVVDPTSDLSALELADAECRARGLRWLRRLALAVGRCRTAEPSRCAEVLRIAAARQRLGDLWGATLIESAVALSLLRHGRPDVDLLDRLCDRYRALGAPVLEAWARSALALAVAGGDFPDSDVVTSAVAFARAGGALGPLALAYAALASSTPQPDPDLLALVRTTARSAGLSCRPWTWIEGPVPGVTKTGPRSASPLRTARPQRLEESARPGTVSSAIGIGRSRPR